MLRHFRQGNRGLCRRSEPSTNHLHLRSQRTVRRTSAKIIHRTSVLMWLRITGGKTFHVTGAPIVWATTPPATIGIRHMEVVETCIIGTRVSVIRRPANSGCAWEIPFRCLPASIAEVCMREVWLQMTRRIMCTMGNRHTTWMCAKVGIVRRQLVLPRVVV